jgi:PAS domain S-box-containing protein
MRLTSRPLSLVARSYQRVNRLLAKRHAFWILFLPFVLMFLALGGLAVYKLRGASLERISLLQGVVASSAVLDLESALASDPALLHGLVSAPHVRDLLLNPTPANLRHLEAVFDTVLRQNPRISDLRWIDAGGVERVHLRSRQGHISVLPTDARENRMEWDSFQKAMALPAAQVHISPIELFERMGKPEQPLLPTVRLASPVVDGRGLRHGVVVVNRSVQALLDALPAEAHFGSRTLLVNQDGDWLKAPNAEDAWGKQLGHTRSFAQQYPDTWQAMQTQHSGTHSDARAHWAWRTLDTTRLKAAAADVAVGPKLRVLSRVEVTLIDKLTQSFVTLVALIVVLILVVLGLAWRWLIHHAQMLERSRRMLEMSNTVTQTGTWEMDLGTRTLFFSPLALEPGAPKAAFTPSYKQFLACIAHPEQRKLVESSIQAAADHGTPAMAEIEFRMPSGQCQWRSVAVYAHQEAGQSVRLYGTSQNITDRKHRELELAAQQQRLTNLIDGTKACTWEWNVQTNDVVINANYAALLGYTLDELTPFDMARWAQFLDPVEMENSMAIVKRHFSGELPYYADTFRLKTRHGDTVWVQNRGRVEQYTPDGQPLIMQGILNNITDLVTARQHAEKANQAKSDFLSSMSHELRTPMNAILGFGQLLEADSGLNDDQRESVQEINKAGRHLLGLINEVLDLSKIESGQLTLSREPVQLLPLLQECVGLAQPLARERHISLHLTCAPDVVVQADRVRLMQVLLNLVSNAIKYNRPQGHVWVHARAQGNRCHVSVKDTGPGVPADIGDTLFQPFTRSVSTQNSVEGTGIGLSITRRLLEHMGGHIDFSTEDGVGTEFWFDLPLAQPLSAGADEVSADVLPATQPSHHRLYPAAQPGQRTVLSIDDNPANLKLIERMIGTGQGITLLSAHTPQMGLDLARTHRPDLVLLDINMPGMDGYEVLARLRAEPNWVKHTPVVAVTANAMANDVAKGLEAGFTAYLTKPFAVDELLHTVNTLLPPPGNASGV